MRVAVIGGAGFVGSHIVDSLVEKGHEVVVVDNFFLGKMSNLKDATSKANVKVINEDAKNLNRLKEIIKTEQTPVVVNLAMKCLPTSFTDPQGAFMEGVVIAMNLLELLRTECYNRLIHFSSSEVYGTAMKEVISESHPTNPTTPYAAGKLAADHALLVFQKMFRLEIAIIRPFNLIGPRQNSGLYAGIVPFTIKRILEGKAPIIEWDGLQTRDFTYVRDLTDYIPSLVDFDNYANAMFMNFNGKAVNFGSGKETTIEEIIFRICNELDFPTDKIEYKPKRSCDVRRMRADISQAQALIGYKPKTSLKEAIHRTVEWFKQNVPS